MKNIAFITGGTRGIGLGIAEHLAKNGFDLAINGIRPEESVLDVLENLRKLGADVIYCQGDISSSEDRKMMLEKIKNHYGRLNILVNNAGIAPKERNDVLATTEESFDEVLDINLKGTFFLTQAVANWLISQKADSRNAEPKDFAGSIITISSISATIASVNRGEYCISKAGLGMMTQLFAARLGEYNIPVYELRPGIIKTDMTEGVKLKYDKLIAEGSTVQKRWGFPDDVGKAVASIAKGDFPYSTGQVFMIDGGLAIARL